MTWTEGGEMAKTTDVGPFLVEYKFDVLLGTETDELEVVDAAERLGGSRRSFVDTPISFTLVELRDRKLRIGKAAVEGEEPLWSVVERSDVRWARILIVPKRGRDIHEAAREMWLRVGSPAPEFALDASSDSPLVEVVCFHKAELVSDEVLRGRR